MKSSRHVQFQQSYNLIFKNGENIKSNLFVKTQRKVCFSDIWINYMYLSFWEIDMVRGYIKS